VGKGQRPSMDRRTINEQRTTNNDQRPTTEV
jgi:hypothetical protein